MAGCASVRGVGNEPSGACWLAIQARARSTQSSTCFHWAGESAAAKDCEGTAELAPGDPPPRAAGRPAPSREEQAAESNRWKGGAFHVSVDKLAEVERLAPESAPPGRWCKHCRTSCPDVPLPPAMNHRAIARLTPRPPAAGKSPPVASAQLRRRLAGVICAVKETVGYPDPVPKPRNGWLNSQSPAVSPIGLWCCPASASDTKPRRPPCRGPSECRRGRCRQSRSKISPPFLSSSGGQIPAPSSMYFCGTLNSAFRAERKNINCHAVTDKSESAV